MIPTVEQVEEYFHSVEELVFTSLSSVTPELPQFKEAVNRLWEDVSRYGPAGLPKSFPEINIPGLGDFQVPPPPPPPPPPRSWMDKSADWVGEHKWVAGGIGVGVVGTGMLVGYGAMQVKYARIRRIKAKASDRRQVVVVLGGDTPLALPLILDLENKGYIVIASVASPEAVDALEHKCRGYVRALVLDPTEPGTVPVFLRSLASTLSRRFPMTSAGDPHASPSTHPYIHSLISLLTLPSSSPGLHVSPSPLEHLSLHHTYLPYLTASHITPLQVIQAILPLLRTNPSRARDSAGSKGKKTIIFCVPAVDARVGLPFAAVQGMSAAATLKAAEVLRREIEVAKATDKSESMKNIRVVVVDVGRMNVGAGEHVSSGDAHDLPLEDVYRAMDDWTASEKLTYGPSFVSIAHPTQVAHAPSRLTFASIFRGGFFQYGAVPRKPTDVRIFAHTLVSVVSGGGRDAWGYTGILGLGVGFGTFRNWARGDRFSVGAGAHTYALASHLPSLILDALLNIPHFLISIRNSLLPLPPPPVIRPRHSFTPSSSASAMVPLDGTLRLKKPLIDSQYDVEAVAESPETDSEADADIEIGEPEPSSGTQSVYHGVEDVNRRVEESWVSLHEDV